MRFYWSVYHLTLSLMWMLVKYSEGTWKSKKNSSIYYWRAKMNWSSLQVKSNELIPMSCGRHGAEAQGDANLGYRFLQTEIILRCTKREHWLEINIWHKKASYSGELRLSPSVVRSLPKARWTIPGSVSAARMNVSSPIIPNWSVTIPKGMFVTLPIKDVNKCQVWLSVFNGRGCYIFWSINFHEFSSRCRFVRFFFFSKEQILVRDIIVN